MGAMEINSAEQQQRTKQQAFSSQKGNFVNALGTKIESTMPLYEVVVL